MTYWTFRHCLRDSWATDAVIRGCSSGCTEATGEPDDVCRESRSSRLAEAADMQTIRQLPFACIGMKPAAPLTGSLRATSEPRTGDGSSMDPPPGKFRTRTGFEHVVPWRLNQVAFRCLTRLFGILRSAGCRFSIKPDPSVRIAQHPPRNQRKIQTGKLRAAKFPV